MKTHRKLVAFVAALTIIQPVAAQAVQTDWSVDPAFEFSLRCSKAPRRVEFAGLSGTLVNQIYLKLAGDQLTRLAYSTAIDTPHDWMNSESPVVYSRSNKVGNSKIQSERRYRKSGSDTISNIVVTLDASAAQDMLSILMSDFVTYGKWSIFKKSGTLTLEENTSTFVNGTLSQSASTYWTACKLMTADGTDIYF